MKKRILTGIILTILLAPIIYFGSYLMAAFIFLLMILGVYELLHANNNNIPKYIYFICCVFAYLLIFDLPLFNEYAFLFENGGLKLFLINPLWLVLFIIILLATSVFDKRFSIIDSVYCISLVLYLSLGLKGMLFLRTFNTTKFFPVENDGLILILYVLLITCMTDIFAYFTGMLCYKVLGKEKVHKLNERISPKKTIEGTIGGTLIGTIAGFIFAILLFKNTNLPQYNAIIYLPISLVLSLFGQIGDLILSAVKRYFNIKDYSNLLPGHGGVLDRCDSFLINSMLCSCIIMIIMFM
ncbi:MAG: phosphatidate cytidylyltransferase [Erysipelotrichaceae bacterium]|nr:phosphatidate cytidylyltransferase [Erysipelotrichaceae bacterium]